eukprot:Hpha_TRINITY_DN15941_c3_g2::TRINITY_DN15941_c3_g2_i1::g.71783::m.71783
MDLQRCMQQSAAGFMPLDAKVLPSAFKLPQGVPPNAVYCTVPVIKVSTGERRQERMLLVTSSLTFLCKMGGAVTRILRHRELGRIVVQKSNHHHPNSWGCAIHPSEGMSDPSWLLTLQDSPLMRPVAASPSPLLIIGLLRWMCQRATGRELKVEEIRWGEELRPKHSRKAFAKPAGYLSPRWIQNWRQDEEKDQHEKAQMLHRRRMSQEQDGDGKDQGMLLLLELEHAEQGIGIDYVVEEDDAGQTWLWVSAVTPGSPADAAGVRLGDEVLRMDMQEIRREADLQRVRALAMQQKRLKLVLSVTRGMPHWASFAQPEALTIELSDPAQMTGIDFAVHPGSGIEISGVEIGSAAERAGLEEDMWLLEVDGERVETLPDLMRVREQVRTQGRYDIPVVVIRPPERVVVLLNRETAHRIDCTDDFNAQGKEVVRITSRPDTVPSGIVVTAHGRPVNSADDFREAVAFATADGVPELAIEMFTDDADGQVPILGPPPVITSPASVGIEGPESPPEMALPGDGEGGVWKRRAQRRRRGSAGSELTGTARSIETGPFGKPRTFRVWLDSPQEALGMLLSSAEGDALPFRVAEVEPDGAGGRARVPRGLLHTLNELPVLSARDVAAIIRKGWARNPKGPMRLDFFVEPWLGHGPVPNGEELVQVATKDGQQVRFLLYEGDIVEYVNGIRVGIAKELQWDPAVGIITDHNGAGTVIPRSQRQTALERLARMADKAGVPHNIPAHPSPSPVKPPLPSPRSPADHGQGAPRIKTVPPLNLDRTISGTRRVHVAPVKTAAVVQRRKGYSKRTGHFEFGDWERGLLEVERQRTKEELRWHRELCKAEVQVRCAEAEVARGAEDRARALRDLKEEATALEVREARLKERMRECDRREERAVDMCKRLHAAHDTGVLRELVTDIRNVGERCSVTEELTAVFLRVMAPPVDEQRVYSALRAVRDNPQWEAVRRGYSEHTGSDLIDDLARNLTKAELRAAHAVLATNLSDTGPAWASAVRSRRRM